MNHHSEAVCTPPCPFHAPSAHGMVAWPTLIRETALVERLCSHGIGHPDPDSLAYFARITGDVGWGVHGCDGCCHVAMLGLSGRVH